ncbi:hypothetical protein PMI10_00645 [Flavobacterium sp. CF136]|nr:hypothetical protein PMI10_00645 [Flavobacterium sp. CF136]
MLKFVKTLLRYQKVSYIYMVELKRLLIIKFKIMITREVYLKALDIVEAYHDQVRLESLNIKEVVEPKQKLKDLEEVEIGDFVKCVFVHSASTIHLTKEKKYEVINTDNYRFMIETDSGKKKWYHKDNGHFRALN